MKRARPPAATATAVDTATPPNPPPPPQRELFLSWLQDGLPSVLIPV